MLRNYIIITIAFSFLLPCLALANANVPDASIDIAEQLDVQLIKRFSIKTGNMTSNFGSMMASTSTLDSKKEKIINSNNTKREVSIAVTTPVNINDLDKTCPLARQISEEIMSWMVSEGYTFEEMRKGKIITFTEQKGETILSRDTKKLAKKSVTTTAIMVGTYILTPNQVRFNIKLIGTGNNEILAMGSSTVAITRNLRPLLVESRAEVVVRPSIGVRLQ